jgi:hypothetical protein
MGLLGKEELLKRDELTIKKVEFSNGDFVYVREMTGRERDTFERSLLKEVKGKNGEVDYQRNLEDFRAKLAASTLCDENGNLLLKFNEHPKLSQSMSASRLEKIVNVAQKINSISEEDKEGLVKNSEGGQKGNSTSDSAAS